MQPGAFPFNLLADAPPANAAPVSTANPAPASVPATSHLAETLAHPADSFRQLVEDLQRIATTYGVRIVGAVIFISVAWVVASSSSRVAGRWLRRTHMDVTVSKFIATSLRWVILALSVVTCLNIFGIETTSFAAVIGALGLAIGLAFQGTLSNLAAGAMLLIFRPFKVGDSVVVAGQSGVVDGIELFITKLDTADNRRIIIPNSSIVGAIIENQSYHVDRRATVTITVSYRADLARTRAALTKAGESVSGRLADHPVEVGLNRLAPLGVEWETRVWTTVDKLGSVQEATATAVKNALDAADIEIVTPPLGMGMPPVGVPDRRATREEN